MTLTILYMGSKGITANKVNKAVVEPVLVQISFYMLALITHNMVMMRIVILFRHHHHHHHHLLLLQGFSYLSGVGARGLLNLGNYHLSHQNWEF